MPSTLGNRKQSFFFLFALFVFLTETGGQDDDGLCSLPAQFLKRMGHGSGRDRYNSQFRPVGHIVDRWERGKPHYGAAGIYDIDRSFIMMVHNIGKDRTAGLDLALAAPDDDNALRPEKRIVYF